MPLEVDPAAVDVVIDGLLPLGRMGGGDALEAREWNGLVRAVAALAHLLGGREVDWTAGPGTGALPAADGSDAAEADLAGRLAALERMVPAIGSRVGGLEGAVARTPGRLDALEAQVAALASRVAGLRADAGSGAATGPDPRVDSLAEALRTNAEADARRADRFEERLAEQATSLTGLGSRLAALEARLATIEARVEDPGTSRPPELDLGAILDRLRPDVLDRIDRLELGASGADSGLGGLRTRLEAVEVAAATRDGRLSVLSGLVTAVREDLEPRLGAVELTATENRGAVDTLRDQGSRTAGRVEDLAAWRSGTELRIEALASGVTSAADLDLAGRVGALRDALDAGLARLDQAATTDRTRLDAVAGRLDGGLADLAGRLDARDEIVDGVLATTVGRLDVVGSTLAAQGAQLDQALGELRDERADLASALDAVDGRLASLATSVDTRLSGVGTDLAALEATLSRARAELGAVDGRLATLDGRLAAAETGAADLATWRGGIDGRIAALAAGGGEADVELAGRLGALEATVGQRTTAVDARLAAAESSLAAVTTWRGQAQEELGRLAVSLEAGDAALGARLDATTLAVDRLAAGEVAELRAGLAELDGRLATTGERVAGLLSDLDGTTARITEATMAIGTLGEASLTRSDALEARVAANEATVAESRQALAALGEQGTAAAAALDALRGTVAAGEQARTRHLAEVAGRLDAAEAAAGAITSRVAAVEDRAAGLSAVEGRLASTEDSLAGMASWRAGLDARISAVAAGATEGEADLAERLGVLEQGVAARTTAVDGRLAALDRASADSAERLAAVEGLATSNGTRLGAIELSATGLGTRLAGLATTTTELAGRVEAMKRET